MAGQFDQGSRLRRQGTIWPGVFRLDVAPGIYAINGFHDENGNGKFDTNFLGISEEGYFFSNNVRPFLSAPGFEAVKFVVPPEGRAMTVRVIY